MDMSRDAGSIPAASTEADLREIVSRLFSYKYAFLRRFSTLLAFEKGAAVGATMVPQC